MKIDSPSLICLKKYDNKKERKVDNDFRINHM